MAAIADAVRARLPLLAALALVLLLIRFVFATALAAVSLSQESLVAAGRFLDVYEVLLAPFLVSVYILVLYSLANPLPRALRLLVVGLIVVTLYVWLYGLSLQALVSVFPPLGMATLVTASIVAVTIARPEPATTHAKRLFIAVAVVVLVAFGLRIVASLGFGTSPGDGGTLRGNWLLVYGPSILVAFLAIGVWLEVVFELGAPHVRTHRFSLVPFALVPAFLFGVSLIPLAGYILSALITRGSNLAVFIPAEVSLGLALVALAAYFSALILIRPSLQKTSWNVLFLGSGMIVIAGFFPSMTSVMGLSLALALAAIGCARHA